MKKNIFFVCVLATLMIFAGIWANKPIPGYQVVTKIVKAKTEKLNILDLDPVPQPETTEGSQEMPDKKVVKFDGGAPNGISFKLVMTRKTTGKK